MTNDDTALHTSRLNGWRIAGWGALAALLALPALAMLLTDEVDWTLLDFVFAGVLLAALGTGVELAFRLGRSAAHTVGIVLFSLTAFFTLWSNLAVGIIGDESEPINAGFTLLTVAGAITALAVRLRASVMHWVAGILAVSQPVIGLVALSAMTGNGVEWGVLGVLALMWGGAALLFRHSARR